MSARRLLFYCLTAVMFVMAAAAVSMGPGPASATGGAEQVTAGVWHTCTLMGGGGVQCWGYNGSGELGDGTMTNRAAPVAVSGLPSVVTAVAVGGSHTCALTAGGGIKCWGRNFEGQLGDGTTSDRTVPVDVSGLTSGVTAVSAGGSHTCALTAGGGVKCWGLNADGQLGDGTTTDRAAPGDVSGLVSGVTALAAGVRHTCALTVGGGVKCWGGNAGGQLGDGTTTNRAAPVAVSGLGSGVTALAAGDTHTCALTVAGGVKCWGYNGSGQLGDGTTSDRTAPVDVSGLASGVTAVSAGGQHTCALAAEGGVKCWGWNSLGQLGDGTTTDRAAPGDVSGLISGVTSISVGSQHTCALTVGGGVKCWGLNSDGQLGDGATTNRAAPVDVMDRAVVRDPATPLPIPDGNLVGMTDSLTMSGPATIEDLNVFLGISHSYVGDLTVTLTHDDTGTSVMLIDQPAAGAAGLFVIRCDGDDIRAVLDDEAPSSVQSQCGAARPTIDGDFSPVGPLSLFSGESLAGTWTLSVTDNSAGDVGTLDAWALYVVDSGTKPTPTPPPPAPLSGDANCDGAVNSIDAALALQLSAGLINALPCQNLADLNLDGRVDAIDAALILQYIAGFGIPLS